MKKLPSIVIIGIGLMVASAIGVLGARGGAVIPLAQAGGSCSPTLETAAVSWPGGPSAYQIYPPNSHPPYPFPLDNFTQFCDMSYFACQNPNVFYDNVSNGQGAQYETCTDLLGEGTLFDFLGNNDGSCSQLTNNAVDLGVGNIYSYYDDSSCTTGCMGDNDCSTGDICDTYTNTCIQSAPSGCTNDTQCPGGYCDMSTGSCVDGGSPPPPPPPTPYFIVTLSPGVQSINPGQSATYVVGLTSVDGDTENVGLLNWFGLPGDSTANFSGGNSIPLVANGTVNANFVVSTANDTPPGTYTLEVYGSDLPNGTSSNPVTLIVNNPATFNISPTSASTMVGGSVQFHGWYNPNPAIDPTIEVTTDPSIVWASNNATVATMNSGVPGEADGVAAGSAGITATYQGITTQPSALNIFSVASPDFSLAASPMSQSVTEASGVVTSTYAITASAINGYSAPISLSVGSLLAGVTGSFSPASITPGQTAILTLSVAPTAGVGISTFSVTGTGGFLVHSINPQINIMAPSGPGTHYECVQDACTSVPSSPGDTNDRCNIANGDADCGGGSPGNGAVSGVCNSASQTCANSAVSGGTPCSSDSDCTGGLGGEVSHLTCEKNACLIVSGAGVNGCAAVGTSCAPPPPPPACTFNASPMEIVPPQQSTLSWACSNAASCTITGIGSVNATGGSLQVSPASSTQYTLDCLGSVSGSFASSVVVTVSNSHLRETNP